MSRFAFGAARRGVACTVALLGLFTAACQSAEVTCPADLRFTRTPADTIIDVGKQFQAHVTALGCGGTQPLTDTFTWTSSDSSVATVDVTTGLVTGQKTGLASIWADGRIYHGVVGIQVRVR